MNPHKYYRWSVLLIFLTAFIPAFDVSGSSQVQSVRKIVTSTERQIPTESDSKTMPLEKRNPITGTVTIDHSDDPDNQGDQNHQGNNISLQQERYAADIKTAQLNEARRLIAPANDPFSMDKPIQVAAEPDNDDDGMPNTWESANGLNPNNPADAWADPDYDQVINLFEYQLGSNPHNNSTPVVVKVSAGGNVEAAIDAAPSGRVIRVEGGTYNVNYLTFTPKTIMLQGGWNSSFTLRNLRATPTIFNGQFAGEVLYFSFNSGINAVILDGLTLMNGRGSFGALNMIANGTSVMKWSIMNTTIVNSESTSTSGGGAHILHWNGSTADVFIVNSIAVNNLSSGLYNQTSDTAVGRWKIINSDITHNQSSDAGEGYGLDGFTLDNAILSIKAKNTILWGNQKTDLNIRGFGDSTIIEAEYSDIGPVNAAFGAIYTPGTGIINEDPLFTDVGQSNFTLQKTSPCIDVGTNSGVPLTDFEGNLRVMDGNFDSLYITDIGADEYAFRTNLPILLK